MTITPKLPEGLETVAWLDDGLSASNGTEGTSFRVVTDKTKRDMPHAAVVAYTTPLVRLSDAQAALLALAAEKDAEIAFLKLQIETGPLYSTRLKAKRYEFLRDTNDAMWRPFGIREGTADEADAAIDSALLAAKEAK